MIQWKYSTDFFFFSDNTAHFTPGQSQLLSSICLYLSDCLINFLGEISTLLFMRMWLLTQSPNPKLEDCGRLRLKCDGTRTETGFHLPAKRMSPFKSVGLSVQSTTGSRGVHISGNNAGYTRFRGSVKSTGYPLHSPVSPSIPLLCVTVCHHISTGLYLSMSSTSC